MSEKSFSRRRRGGMRFRPSGGVNPNIKRPDRAAQEARAEVIGEKPTSDTIYAKPRFQREIERAENVAAGLPPEGQPKTEIPSEEALKSSKKDFRQPHMDTPAEVK